MSDEANTSTTNPDMQNTPVPASGTPPATLTWDAWHAGLNDEQKKLIESKFGEDTKSLKGALDKERDGSKHLEKQIKSLQDKFAEKGSELEKALTDLQAQLAAATQEKQFILDAPAKGVSNIKAAYKLAAADGLIDPKGAIDWDALKSAYPELFAAAKPPAPPDTNAGNTGKKSADQQLQDATALAAKKFGIRVPTIQ